MNPNVDPAAELQRLQSSLAARDSIRLYATGAVALVVSSIAGAGIALFVGMMGWNVFFQAGLGVVGLAVLVALVFMVRGRIAQRSEDVLFARMIALRRELGVDDPSRLLPSP